jgi:MFS family permease
MYTGSILGLALSPHMIAGWGWPSVFYIFGTLGVGWFAFWLQTAASSPNVDRFISDEERAYIVKNTCDQVGPPSVYLCIQPSVWNVCLSVHLNTRPSGRLPSESSCLSVRPFASP